MRTSATGNTPTTSSDTSQQAAAPYNKQRYPTTSSDTSQQAAVPYNKQRHPYHSSSTSQHIQNNILKGRSLQGVATAEEDRTQHKSSKDQGCKTLQKSTAYRTEAASSRRLHATSRRKMNVYL
jgi:hypothetical protein